MLNMKTDRSVLIYVRRRGFSLFFLLLFAYIAGYKHAVFLLDGNLMPTVPLPFPVISNIPMPCLPGAPLPWYQWALGFAGSLAVCLLTLLGIPKGERKWPERSAIFVFSLLLVVGFLFTMWKW